MGYCLKEVLMINWHNFCCHKGLEYTDLHTLCKAKKCKYMYSVVSVNKDALLKCCGAKYKPLVAKLRSIRGIGLSK